MGCPDLLMSWCPDPVFSYSVLMGRPDVLIQCPDVLMSSSSFLIFSSTLYYHQDTSSVHQNIFRGLNEDSYYYVLWKSGNVCFLVVYMDVLLLATSSRSYMNSIKEMLSSSFKMYDLGEAKYLLGVEIWRDRTTAMLEWECQNIYQVHSEVSEGYSCASEVSRKFLHFWGFQKFLCFWNFRNSFHSFKGHLFSHYILLEFTSMPSPIT